MLKKVQYWFTRTVPGMKELPYKDRLKKLGLWTLEERRNRADLLEMFKTSIGKSEFRVTLWKKYFLSSTRDHSTKLVKHQCNLDFRKHFLSERVIDHWNQLSEDCVSCDTVNKFKGKLGRWKETRLPSSKIIHDLTGHPGLISWTSSGCLDICLLVWPDQVNKQVNNNNAGP